MERSASGSEDDLLPQAKKQRASEAPGNKTGEPERLRNAQKLVKPDEFPVRNLEGFYKPCPSYRLPVEYGAFCIDGEGKFCHDRSQLRYYVSHSRPHPSMDLRIGYQEFVPKKENVPVNRLDSILKWISQNGECFRVRENPKSPDKNGEVSGSGRFLDPPPVAMDRPEHLMTNFITWRGMVTKMLCSPYNKTEPWKMAATLHKGTIYLSEIETEYARERMERQSAREQEMCYWGHKFEDYMTASGDPPSLNKGMLLPTSAVDRPGTVNCHKGFCTVVRTRMNTHSIIMVGEVDCYDHLSKEKSPQNYIELKTSRVILTDRNKASFRRHKLMKWWAQSFLVGVPKIVCGFRNDDGIVKSLQTFKTADIPKETQSDLSLWQPSVCLNFLNELLTWIRKTVIKDDPRVVYIIEWNAPYTHVSCMEYPPDSPHVFLPEWYIRRQSPPEV